MAPARTLVRDVVEQDPSHGGVTPCFTAWDGSETRKPWHTLKGYRPPFSIQIYDTTKPLPAPPSSSPEAAVEHVRQRADRLWRVHIGRPMDDYLWRLNVYGLSVPADATDEERVLRCIAHQRDVEIPSRLATGRVEYHIPVVTSGWPGSYRRVLIIIVEPDETRWNEGEGGWIEVHWDRRDKATSEDTSEDLAPYRFWRVKLEKNDMVMAEATMRIQSFYQCYVHEGHLVMRARAKAREKQKIREKKKARCEGSSG